VPATTLGPAVKLIRDRLTWLTYGHLAVWGYFLYAFGPVVPLLRDEQHTTRAVASLHGTALALGAMLIASFVPWFVRRFGRITMTWIGQAGVSIGVLGLCFAHPLPATLACTLIIAIFGSLVVNGVTTVLTAHHGTAAAGSAGAASSAGSAGAAAISEANAGAAGAGMVGPLVVGATMAIGLGWRPGLAAVLPAIGVLALLAWVFRVPETAASHAARSAPTGGKLPRRYWLVWVSLLATTSVEVCMNLWAVDVLRDHARVPAAAATAALSAIVGGMFVGRLAGVRLALRIAPAKLLLMVLGVSALFFAVFWLATVPWLAIVALVGCGVGNALHFPLGMALAARFSGGLPDLAVARTSFAIGVAFGVVPFVLGAIADRIGPHLAFLLLPVFLGMSAAAAFQLSRARAGDVSDSNDATVVAISL
jgi:MFS family permease